MKKRVDYWNWSDKKEIYEGKFTQVEIISSRKYLFSINGYKSLTAKKHRLTRGTRSGPFGQILSMYGFNTWVDKLLKLKL